MTLRMSGIAKVLRRRDDDRRDLPRHDGRLSPMRRGHDDAQAPRPAQVNLQQLLKAMIEKGASDMHITTGSPPLLRIDGTIVPLKLPPLGAERDEGSSATRSSPRSRSQFEKTNELDLSFGVKGALALPREHLRAARRGGRRVPDDPVQDPDLRGARAARRSSASSRRSRAASSWSPGRPARARAPRSRHHRQDQQRAAAATS